MKIGINFFTNNSGSTQLMCMALCVLPLIGGVGCKQTRDIDVANDNQMEKIPITAVIGRDTLGTTEKDVGLVDIKIRYALRLLMFDFLTDDEVVNPLSDEVRTMLKTEISNCISMKQIEQLCRQQLSDVAEIIVENLDDIKCIFIHNSHDECIMTIQGVRDDFFTGNSKTAQEAKIQSNEFLEAFLKTFP